MKVTYIHKTFWNGKRFQGRFYQEPDRLTLSIGINWYGGGPLFHIHVLFWEIDIEYIPKHTEELEQQFNRMLNEIFDDGSKVQKDN